MLSKAKLPISKEVIRLAVLGMVEENGHPYSWSAIFNGYDEIEMSKNPYPGIYDYLSKQPKEAFGIPGARVTHIWSDNPEDAVHVAKSTFISNIARHATDVIGHVDAVIIATDKGYEHVERCKPFIEAGLPVFVDKPLADNEQDLKMFIDWVANGAAVMSSSSMRYCKEYLPYRLSTHNLGEIRFASIVTCKSWERYGIHALEGVYPILGTGFLSVRNTGTRDRNIVHLKHKCGADVLVVATDDMYGGFGALQLCGTTGYAQALMADDFYAFKTQLTDFIKFLKTGIRTYPFCETEELIKILIAGIKSREESGSEVLIR